MTECRISRSDKQMLEIHKYHLVYFSRSFWKLRFVFSPRVGDWFSIRGVSTTGKDTAVILIWSCNCGLCDGSCHHEDQTNISL